MRRNSVTFILAGIASLGFVQEASAAMLDDQVSALEIRIARLEKYRTLDSSNLNALLTRVQALESAKSQEDAKIASLQRNVTSLETRVAELKSQGVAGTVNIPSCIGNLRIAPVGFKCKTSKGGTFERVAREGFAEAWKDQNGYIWSEKKIGPTYGKWSYPDIANHCGNLNAIVPGQAQLEAGEAIGYREVLDFEDPAPMLSYWTSTPADPAHCPNQMTFLALWADSSDYPAFGCSQPTNNLFGRCVAAF